MDERETIENIRKRLAKALAGADERHEPNADGIPGAQYLRSLDEAYGYLYGAVELCHEYIGGVLDAYCDDEHPEDEKEHARISVQ